MDRVWNDTSRSFHFLPLPIENPFARGNSTCKNSPLDFPSIRVYIVGMRYLILLCIGLVIAAKVAAHVGAGLKARMEHSFQMEAEKVAIDP